MKRFVFLVSIALTLVSCSQMPESDFAVSNVCFNTLKDVYGHYTLKEAFWNYHDNHPGDMVDLSGDDICNDVVILLKRNGWHGIQEVTYHDSGETLSALDASFVMLPPKKDASAQVNLYLPFFMFYRNSSEEEPGPPLQIDGKCCASMNVYQFWYTVDDTGEISITNHDSVRHGETFLLTNVSVAFDKGFGQSRILLSADTRLYDFSSKEFKDGRFSATFVRR